MTLKAVDSASPLEGGGSTNMVPLRICCTRCSRRLFKRRKRKREFSQWGGELGGAFPFSRSCYHQRERGISHLFQQVPASGFVEGAEHEYFLGIVLAPKDTCPLEA
jgi:hypothetical protein